MRETGGVLSIALAPTEKRMENPITGIPLPPGAYVRLEVSDTGTGIGKKSIEKIFDPITRPKPKGKARAWGLPRFRAS